MLGYLDKSYHHFTCFRANWTIPLVAWLNKGIFSGHKQVSVKQIFTGPGVLGSFHHHARHGAWSRLFLLQYRFAPDSSIPHLHTIPFSTVKSSSSNSLISWDLYFERGRHADVYLLYMFHLTSETWRMAAGISHNHSTFTPSKLTELFHIMHKYFIYI
jgi:hypothetical protein